VNRRIKLRYGEKYGIRRIRQPQDRITIHLPCVREQ
jgi:LytS/YehU family sensor histidine kinase